ncbi:MAG: AbrB/MazE/SpoVT family DNA-binding domain-containing protein [Candidatus Rhabdochlamydia sp.]
MLKKLTRHGNSKALVIHKALLLAAGLDEDTALFQITINPNGGMTIQSIKTNNDSLHKKAFKKVLKEIDVLMKSCQNDDLIKLENQKSTHKHQNYRKYLSNCLLW